MNSTPYFLFNKEFLNQNLNSFKKINNTGVDVFYALKANNHEEVVKGIINSGFGFDVASIEEIELALALGAQPKDISFSAPSKFPEDIKKAIEKGIIYFAFDSEIEAKKILSISREIKLFARVSTNTKNAAFNLSEKFGMSKDYFDYILEIAKRDNWPIKGLSFHIGSQNIGEEAWEEGFTLAEEYIVKANNLGVSIDMLNIGGGIPAQYTADVKPLDEYINELIIRTENIKKMVPLEKIIIEPGRAMVANTMELHTSIIDIKPYKEPPLIILDSSVFGGIIEALEHFEYPIEAKETTSAELKKYRVGGYTCDGYDIIKQEVLLPSDLEVGDCLIIKQAGAYTSVFDKFQMKPFPKIYY